MSVHVANGWVTYLDAGGARCIRSLHTIQGVDEIDEEDSARSRIFYTQGEISRETTSEPIEAWLRAFGLMRAEKVADESE